MENTNLVDFVAQIAEQMESFKTDANANAEKSNKAAGVRARKTSLRIEKMFKEYRKVSM